ncbi:hypothetical protein POPTR_019G088850v4 [Populus trichocarpa]|uniref:Uncharacterized protein n=1 Tax=Populus trichocarpa TaxID=3694 RepID=A0ACC0RK46_POPTR|nr:hypothetical protein POPTR_019G088850v4 [Populus trichocarpa]
MRAGGRQKTFLFSREFAQDCRCWARDLPSLPQPTSLLLISMAWGVSFLLKFRRQQYAWTVGGRLWPGFQ